MNRASAVLLILFSLLPAACGSESSEPRLAAVAPNEFPRPGVDPVQTDAGGVPVNAATAQRIFSRGGKTYVPADLSRVELDLVIDNSTQETIGTARIIFTVPQEGYPYLLLNAPVISSSLDGATISSTLVSDFEDRNSLLSLDQAASPGREHILEISYSLGTEEVGYRSGGVGLVTAMADISSGNFFEDYGPASFEDDQFKLTLDLSLKGVSNPHRVFTNGALTNLGSFSWRIEFPEYYNSSSFYLHVTDKTFTIRELSYRGLTKTIPITVYSEDSSGAVSAAAELPGLFAELERDYGPFLHDRFVAYISGSGGMEHAGATITSVSALGHELLHSWFGRGVMPVGGRAGWIDEAVASWRDYDYFRSPVPSNRVSVRLDNESIFERFTPFAAYASGRSLMSELDSMFLSSTGGMKPLLAGFFEAYRGRVIGTAELEAYLEAATGTDLGPIFQEYVYGSQAAGKLPGTEEPGTEDRGRHPPALTQEDIEALR